MRPLACVMGACSSNQQTPEERKQIQDTLRSRKLDKKMAGQKARTENVHKLLLLGAGESGKSTLFKQMVMIYGTPEERGMSDDYRETYTEFVLSNVWQNAQVLATQSEEFGPAETVEGKAAVQFFEEKEVENPIPDEFTSFTEETETHLRNLWKDEGIQKCYSNRAQFQLNDSAKYFFDQLDTLCQTRYIPSLEDILRVRIRTTGIVQHDFTIEGVKFQMYDVGGQRNERKKWINCFEDVQAVLFVAAISEFDQMLYEEHTTNRMSEALSLFAEISNASYFANSSIILFLNKQDLFKVKIATKNITDSSCPELRQFPGNCRDFKETSTYVQQCFVSKYKVPYGSNKQLYCHITCATDTNNIKYVFNDVKNIMIHMALGDGGLLDVY